MEIGLRDIVNSSPSLNFYLRKRDQLLMCVKAGRENWFGSVESKPGLELLSPVEGSPGRLTSAVLSERRRTNRVRLKAGAEVNSADLKGKGKWRLTVGSEKGCVRAGKYEVPSKVAVPCTLAPE